MLNSAATTTRTRSPFTQTQWQELEHQALIYKYLVTGTPIPSELIFSVKRSLESSLASRIFPHQSIGWGCFQVGYGRKPDPEPGRCRRTDGKKWRCSKEAYPDSKYCEKHMHRGRNRSRKPVEQLTSSTQIQTSSMSLSGLNPVSTNRNPNPYPVSSSSSPSANSPYSFSPLSCSSSPVESDLFQNSTVRTSPYLYPNCSSSSSARVDKDYRYFNGIREGSDERAFFPESSKTIQDPYNITSNLPMNSTPYKSFTQSQFEALAAEATSKQQQQQQEQQDNDHCFILGTDFKSTAALTRPMKTEKESETQKSLHHFLGESWLDLSSSSTSRQQNDG